MLRFSISYAERPILSLRTGGRIGTLSDPIINPNNLKIEGWYATSTTDKELYVLPSQSVRDLIAKGIVVDDYDALTRPEDLVRLKDTLTTSFELIGKPVFTETGKKLGRVEDYTLDDITYLVQKLYIHPSILQGLNAQQLIVDRNNIVEINDKRIVVIDLNERVSNAATAPASA